MHIAGLLCDLTAAPSLGRQPALSPPTFVAPVAEMHCVTAEAIGCPPSRASASFQGDTPLDARPSTAGAKLANEAMCDHTSGIKTTTVAYESKTDLNVDSILAHRHDLDDKTRFDMHVRWEGGIESWEPEIYLHKHHAPTLFAYWDSVKDGREGVMEDPGLWHVFSIISHKRGPKGTTQFHVAWVGSPKYSWEEEATILDANSELVEHYWESRDRCRKAVRRPIRSKNRLGGGTRATAKDSRDEVKQLRREYGGRRIANKITRLRTRQ